MIISTVDIRILRYLHSKLTPRSIYDIVKGTRYKTSSGIQEISYETIKNHCKKLFDNHLIHKWTNKNSKKRPKVKYAYNLTKTPNILRLIEKQKQLKQKN